MESCDPKNVIKILSDSRHIRACIIISFSIQAFLTIFATSRKYLGGKRGIFHRFLIWLAYLLADWIAIFTIGSISLISLIGSSSENDDNHVFWFWAPFLLLHLGGPDTITAFALQDNELWVRHLFGLIFQVGCTLYVFLGSLPHNKLWRPTLLVFIAAIIKYAERIYAFYLASFDHFGDNWVPGENLDFYLPVERRTADSNKKLREPGLRIPVEFKNLGSSDRLHEMPKKIIVGKLPSEKNNIHQYFAASDSNSIIKAAVYLFGTIRRPLVGSFLSRAQLWKSFANLGSQNKDSSAKEALQKIEIELSLLYEVLHTKWSVVSKIGFFTRALDLGCIGGAWMFFHSYQKQHKLKKFDNWLTSGLLTGALASNFISLILQYFLSDWFFIARLGRRYLFYKDFTNRRRWSKAVSQLNFITYVVTDNDHPSWMKRWAKKCHSGVKKCLSLSYPSWVRECLYHSGVKKCLSLSHPIWVRECLYHSWVKKCLSRVKNCLSLPVSSWVKICLSWVKKWVRMKKSLSLSSQSFRVDTDWCFIFEQLENFSKISTSEMKKKKESFSNGGPISIRPNEDWFTMMVDILQGTLVDPVENIDGETTLGDPFEDRFVDPLEDPEKNIQGEIFLQDLFEDPIKNRTWGSLWNILREYDFTRSLLILHIATELFLQDGPPPPSSSSGSNDHRGTCKLLSDYLFYLAMMESTMIAPLLDSWEKVFGDTYKEAKSVLKLDSIEGNACTKILSDDLGQLRSRGNDLNGSVLILARDLARALKRKRYRANRYDQYDDICKMLSRVWVHLTAYAASNCGPNVHAQQPSKGGELLTFIWLCISNCGDRELNRIMTRVELDVVEENAAPQVANAILSILGG